MKKNTVLWIIAGVAVAAATIFTLGIIHEVSVIKKLTADIDDIPEDEFPEELAD